MDGLDCAKCQKSRKMDKMRIMRNVNENGKNNNSVHLLHLENKNGSGWTRDAVAWRFVILEREGAHLSRFAADRIVGFRRSKK